MKFLLAAMSLLLPLTTHAAGVAVPNAGSILQQVQPTLPQVPSSNGTGLNIEQESTGKLPPSAPFEVKVIVISGNNLFDIKLLHALVADAEGKTLTLSDLDQLSNRITDYYHEHGYPLARAYISAQTIKEGMVRIDLIEARYGQIKLDNRSQVQNTVLQATLAPLKSGQSIEQTAMDRTLLLLSDIPGVD